MTRIKSLDGFRTIAVLGVLWAHIWMFLDAPSYKLINLDIAKIFSFFGTGVDLFFVISGFCMYLMYVSKADNNTTDFIKYIIKRWLRIAPAFYFAVFIYGFIYSGYSLLNFNYNEALKYLFFLKIFFKGTEYGPHFWSLCTEWHFYLILPLIVYFLKRLGFLRGIGLITLLCICFRAFVWHQNSDPNNFINYSIANRLIEFIMGIICAWMFYQKKAAWYCSSILGLFLGVSITFCGRLLMTDNMVNHVGNLGWISRIINIPLLTAGYALVILNILNTKTYFRKILESSLFQNIGKYSYSMYLWHWIFAESIALYFKQMLQLGGFWGVNTIFLLSLLVLYPVSFFSYQVFEAFYFKKTKKNKMPNTIWRDK